MSIPTICRMLFWTLLLSFCLTLSPGRLLAQQPSAQEGQVTLDFKDVELTDLIQTISELTGENFLYDDSVKGKATIISPVSMTLDEAYQLFLTVLNVKGYTVVPAGKVNKIVPLKDAKESSLPTVTGDRGNKGAEVVTRIFRLDHLDADLLKTTVLVPLMPNTSFVASFAPTNSLIITDTAANLNRLADIIRLLDQPVPDSKISVLQLENSDADEVARILNEVMSQRTTPVSRARRPRTAAGATDTPAKIISYPAGQALIVMAEDEDMAVIRSLTARLDQGMEGEKRSNINLYYLENADAVTLATTLNEILSGIKAEAKTAPKGANQAAPLAAGPVTITADKPTNALIINASPNDYRTIREIIEQLDIKRKQVYVEALILELSMDATQRLGVSLQGAATVNGDSVVYGGANQNTGPIGIGDALSTGASGVPDLLTAAVDGLLAGGFFNPISVTGPNGTTYTVPALSLLIDISKKDSDVNLLSAPRLLTSDNEEAEIIVGSNVPIITSRLTDTGSSSGLAQSVSVERQDVALILRFTPQITAGNLVRLNVYQEITDIASTSVGNVNDVGPTFTKRVLRNTVLAQNHKTVVLGGLIDTNVVEEVIKVPLLGDIPLLGWLFKRESTKETKTNLLVFINPTIINGPEDLDKVTGRNRSAASKLMTDRVRGALPENYFDNVPLPAEADSTTAEPAEGTK